LLAVDVSNSIDPGEYRLQIDGMAAALRDPEIVETLVRGEVALSVMQWSGPDSQEISIPWRQMRTALDVENFARTSETLERAFVLSNTAPAEAVSFGLRHFEAAPQCARHVIDVSGDGTANAGRDVRQMRRVAERRGVTINGLAIEGLGVAITNFYRRALITRDGFVMTARGYRDYPRAIRAKILREISQVTG
jgi:Ca-activated chloride channel family protein